MSDVHHLQVLFVNTKGTELYVWREAIEAPGVGDRVELPSGNFQVVSRTWHDNGYCCHIVVRMLRGGDNAGGSGQVPEVHAARRVETGRKATGSGKRL